MRHSLVERLEVFERGLQFVRRRRAEVFVQPPVRRAPALRILLADLLREILAQVRMSIERMRNAECGMRNAEWLLNRG